MSINHNMKENKKIVIGTRKSQLALVQAEYVQEQLTKLYPEFSFPLEKMSTTGDKILDVALSKIGEKALFTKELEMALNENQVDLIVHSLKDLPTTLPEGMALAAIMERENPKDAVVMSSRNKGKRLEDLPEGSVIGTSSVRRISQLKRRFPKLEFQDVRGNLNTRLNKLDAEDGNYSALILAVAGLKRLGWSERISEILEPDTSLHAVGQGALGLECRANDSEVLKLLAPLDHHVTRLRCTAERAMMRYLEGGCSVPVGVNTELNGNRLSLRGMVASLDGKKYLHHEASIEIKDKHGLTEAEKLGEQVAQILLKLGAKEILDEIKKTDNPPNLPFGK